MMKNHNPAAVYQMRVMLIKGGLTPEQAQDRINEYDEIFFDDGGNVKGRQYSMNDEMREFIEQAKAWQSEKK
jgi:hypothetical protein